LNEEGDALDRAYLGLDTLIENAEAIDASGAIYSTIRRSHHSIFEKNGTCFRTCRLSAHEEPSAGIGGGKFFLLLGGSAEHPGGFHRLGYLRFLEDRRVAMKRFWTTDLPFEEVTIY
jgi:hypothetical protein